MCHTGRRGDGLCQHRLRHLRFFNGKMLFFPAFQALEGFPVEVNDFYRSRNKLHLRTDSLPAHGCELCPATFADTLIFRQGDYAFFMRHIFQNLLKMTFLLLAPLMSRDFNDRLRSTAFCLDLSFVEKIDLLDLTQNLFGFLGA